MQTLQDQFDRLAEGELTAEQTRDLFEQLDQNPTQWRQCAIAILEVNLWRREMSRMTNANNLERASEVESHPPVQVNAATPKWSSSRLMPLIKYASLAAMLLFAFTWGRLGSPGEKMASPSPAIAERLVPSPAVGIGSDSPSDSDSDSKVGAPAFAQSTTNASRSPMRDAILVWTIGPDGGRRSMELPLFKPKSNQAGASDRLGSLVSRESREQLWQEGYDIRSTRKFAAFTIDGFGSYVLPVEDSQLVSLSEVAY